MGSVNNEFLTSSQASKLLKVSPGYLRNSDCPKILLPSNGKRAVVRYRHSDLMEWVEKWRVSMQSKAV